MKTSFIKRLPTAVFLGLITGLICTYLAATSAPDIWWSALMWMLIVNRMTIGLVVGVVGVYTQHPIFGFRTPPCLRGAVFGAIISVQLAIGVFITPPVGSYSQVTLFWLTILVGAIYGSIIDMIATKVGGEGKDLLWKK